MEWLKKCVIIAHRGAFSSANNWAWLIGAPLLAVVAWFSHKERGTPMVMPQPSTIYEAIWVGGAALVITWLAIFLFRLLFRAPALLYKELAAENERLKKLIHDRDARQLAIDRLWKLRGDGVGLRNEFPITDDVYRAWQSRFSAWREEVLIAAENINPNLRQWLARLDILGDAALQIAPKERKDVQNMTEILARMGEYLRGEIEHVSRQNYS